MRTDPGSLVRTRPAVAEDAVALRAVHHASRTDLHAAGLPPELLEAVLDQQYDALRSGWAATFSGRDEQVIEAGGQAVGWLVSAAVTPSEQRLVDVTLHPDVRGQGVGTSVLRAFLRQHGGRTVSLHVAHGNPARRLYERLGFVETGSDDVRARMERPPGALS